MFVKVELEIEQFVPESLLNVTEPPEVPPEVVKAKLDPYVPEVEVMVKAAWFALAIVIFVDELEITR